MLASVAAASFSPTNNVDVCVVGAGYAGLTAAHTVRKADKSVVVLEASSRAGGRALDHTWANGAVTELGVEFLGHRADAPSTYKLFVDELGLSMCTPL